MAFRVRGRSSQVEVKAADGATVEKVRLRPDANLAQHLVRTLGTRGRFIYNVCARNEYSLDRVKYRLSGVMDRPRGRLLGVEAPDDEHGARSG